MDNCELFSNKHKGFVRSKFDRNESISNDKFPTILQLEPFHTRRSIRIDRSIDATCCKTRFNIESATSLSYQATAVDELVNSRLQSLTTATSCRDCSRTDSRWGITFNHAIFPL